MSQIIPFEASKLPAFLANMGKPVNDDLTASVGGGFKSLSIKGKIFSIVANKERTTIMNPNDMDEAATNIDVVILKANKTLSKVWYAKEFSDDEGEAGKPDCFSNDGETPDKESKAPQAKSCATCKWNAFGSSKNGKGKACADSRRVAVASPDHINEPMLLRVPAASLKPLAEFGRTLGARGVPYNAVITKLRFELEEATPKLIFKPVGFLTAEQFQEAQEVCESETVGQIIGTIPFVSAAAVEEEAFETPKPEVAPEPKKEEPKKPAAKKEAAPAAKPAVKIPAVKETKPEPVSMEEDLDALLSSLDD